MQDDEQDEDKLSTDEKAAICIPIGICFGVALGSAFQHITLGICFGFLAGGLMSAYVTHTNKE